MSRFLSCFAVSTSIERGPPQAGRPFGEIVVAKGGGDAPLPAVVQARTTESGRPRGGGSSSIREDRLRRVTAPIARLQSSKARIRRSTAYFIVLKRGGSAGEDDGS